MPSAMTVKGQITVPKAVRDALGWKPGDELEVRATPEGVAIIDRVDKKPTPDELKAARRKIEAALRNAPRFRLPGGLTTDQFMHIMRGED